MVIVGWHVRLVSRETRATLLPVFPYAILRIPSGLERSGDLTTTWELLAFEASSN